MRALVFEGVGRVALATVDDPSPVARWMASAVREGATPWIRTLPSSAVRACRAAMDAGIDLTGAVPDVRPYLAHAALVVAPLRIAQGVPNKVLEAMAMAKPVVATPAAIGGLRLEAGRDLLVAATPAAFAEAVARLLEPRSAADLGARARARVIADYSWERSFRVLDRLTAAEPGRADG